MQIRVLAVCFFLMQSAVTNATIATINRHNLRHQVEATPVKQVEQVHALVSTHRSEVSQPGVETYVVAGTRKPKRKLMDFINQFRAEICAKLKDEHGRKFESFKKCKDFMKKACNPGKDGRMDGDKSEVTSKKGYCEEYFHEQKAEKELKEQGETIDEESLAPAPAPQSAPSPVPAPAPAPEALAPAPATPAQAVAAPAPVPGSAPGAAAPSAPADEEAWYFKDGGKSPGRMHMNADLKLPSQGYWGKLIEHDDGKTATGDWGSEFGPRAGRNYVQICKDHPDNVWCERQGFHRHSSSYKATASLVAFLLPFAIGFA